MRDARLSLGFLAFVLAALPCLAVDDGIALTVGPGAGPGQVDLEWSGGTSPYRVYRSTTATSVAATLNLLGETASTSWVDTPPAGNLFFYRVTSVPTVFRVTDLDLRDPHAFFNFIFCVDITDTNLNPSLATAINTDADLDGLLDLSMLLYFRPLDQVSTGGNMDLGVGDCTAPIGTTVCDQTATSPPAPTTFSNVTIGSCLAPYAGTTSGYSPPVAPTSAPPTCFVSASVTFEFDLAGTPIPLQDVQVAANYVGDPAGSLANGLFRGFISEAVADTIVVDLGTFGTAILSSLLPGGTGACAGGDDRDVGLDGHTLGWWFYFNYSAAEVPYIGP